MVRRIDGDPVQDTTYVKKQKFDTIQKREDKFEVAKAMKKQPERVYGEYVRLSQEAQMLQDIENVKSGNMTQDAFCKKYGFSIDSLMKPVE